MSDPKDGTITAYKEVEAVTPITLTWNATWNAVPISRETLNENETWIKMFHGPGSDSSHSLRTCHVTWIDRDLLWC
jgi:hypothetical protein